MNGKIDENTIEALKNYGVDVGGYKNFFFNSDSRTGLTSSGDDFVAGWNAAIAFIKKDSV